MLLIPHLTPLDFLSSPAATESSGRADIFPTEVPAFILFFPQRVPEGLSPSAHRCNPLMSPGFAGSPPCPAQSLHVLPRAPWTQPPDELPAPEPLSQGPLWGPHPETHAHPTRP